MIWFRSTTTILGIFHISREKFVHSNIRFNENSTLTYTITRRLHYLPELNAIDINETIIVPNLAMLVGSTDTIL